MVVLESSEDLRTHQPPLAIPLKNSDGSVTWQTVHDAYWSNLMDGRAKAGRPAESPVELFFALKSAYTSNKTFQFNTALNDYLAAIDKQPPSDYVANKLGLESWFNHLAPFNVGLLLYVVAFLLAISGWLFRFRPLNWATFSLITLTFVVHTAALLLRIYLSGRPPVTNLYSSAIFIGWGAVFVGLTLEVLFRNGIGNVVAAVLGFATLLIASFLGAGGDTIEVLQAVLDTQFWLATHVVCISFGYMATFVAGLLGILFVIFGLTTPHLNHDFRRTVARMIYGITCFAIFFSFIGTVLGGLWADDSWGRFWGWDPKENGALIIVLWNAIVLHARWDKMVGDRGLALLAIGGNIVTGWSWFGVNQLGVGLHSYGFTSGVILALGIFVLSQLIVIGIGLLPKRYWSSYRADDSGKPPVVA
jgi:ABC-type transport system involved in cytochrome c biogenesis permease subunit